VPGEKAGDAASAAYAELVEDAVLMGAHGRDFDFKPMRNLLVAEIVGDHARDLERAYREFQDRRLTVRLRRGRTVRSAGDSTRLSAAAIYMTDSQPN
jgi:hypothetical protein